MSNKQLLQSAGDGTAVPAGYVGETKSAAATTATASGIGSAAAICSLSLEAGTWLLVATTDCFNNTRPTAGASSGGVDLYNSTDASIISSATFLSVWASSLALNDTQNFNGSISAVITITATKTIQYRVKCSDWSGGTTGTPTVVSRTNGKFYAVRIA